MGLFDGIVGGMVGAEMVSVVNGLVARHGGVQGIVTQLEKSGLGGTVRSWVATGPNQPISAQQVQQAFGASTIQDLAAKAGLNPEDVAQRLARVLPEAVDRVTPAGVVPKA